VIIHRILSQLHSEMIKFKQTNTFDALRLFGEVKRYMSLNSYDIQVPEVKASFEQLKAKAPSCLRLLMWPERDDTKMQLVNKFYGSPLCILQHRVLCSERSDDKDGEHFCSATFDPDKVLTSFSLLAGNTAMTLDTSEGSSVGVWNALRWRLKAVDEHHVKICTDDGTKFHLFTQPKFYFVRKKLLAGRISIAFLHFKISLIFFLNLYFYFIYWH